MRSTIAAIATASGRGGIGIIRLSGARALEFAREITKKENFPPREAIFSHYRQANGDLIDEGITLYFPAPNSFTGEAVVELQAHGSPVALDMLLARLVELGATLARPGEFSERAFLNDKIDLTQAEAIADLIEASSQAAVKAAVRSLQGDFSNAISTLNQQIISLRMYVEAAIDFPDEEDVDFIAEGAVIEKIMSILEQLQTITDSAQQGQLLRDGMTIVLAGLPNAGKSSLLNQLAGDERAIVTNIAGTTRDVLREQIIIDGLPLTIIDTAGLRESDDPVEVEGIRRAKVEIAQADHTFYLVDAAQGFSDEDTKTLDQLAQLGANPQRTLLWNKVDIIEAARPPLDPQIATHQLEISAKTGVGITDLRAHIKSLAGFQLIEGGQYLARRRHLSALDIATAHIKTAEQVLRTHNAGELAAEELKLAHQALGEITGEFTADDLLGVIFSQFCIGK